MIVYVYANVVSSIELTSNIICPGLPATGLGIASVLANNVVSDTCALKNNIFFCSKDIGAEAQADWRWIPKHFLAFPALKI